ncbi:MAG: Ribonuclease HIII [Tenericutes bacterium ADurb.Bin087]|nr:MAG: Ribonuclease HIII [Tenericutes bacterium ADurb.Bin087]
MKSYELRIPREDLGIVIAQTKLPTVTNKHSYMIIYYEKGDTKFSIYDNTKNEPYKARYVGARLPKYLEPYLKQKAETLIKEPPKTTAKIITKKITTFPHIGSDEVGFGDFFGPLVVVAAYLDEDLATFVTTLNVKDSKTLEDTKIMLLGNLLKDKVPHVKNIVSNPKYNALIAEGYNMNQMKAMLHQNVLTTLAKRQKYSGKLYLDAFTSDQNYEKYTQLMKKAPVYQLKDGEANSLAIATASILARYYFLSEMEVLNVRYNTKIPLGAGVIVDKFAYDFLLKFGKNNLINIVKHNFRNFKDLFGDDGGLV